MTGDRVVECKPFPWATEVVQQARALPSSCCIEKQSEGVLCRCFKILQQHATTNPGRPANLFRRAIWSSLTNAEVIYPCQALKTSSLLTFDKYKHAAPRKKSNMCMSRATPGGWLQSQQVRSAILRKYLAEITPRTPRLKITPLELLKNGTLSWRQWLRWSFWSTETDFGASCLGSSIGTQHLHVSGCIQVQSLKDWIRESMTTRFIHWLCPW